jgi:hypothetical protein
MAEDLLDAVRDQLANFAVGLAERVDGAGSKVRGSGVLVSVEGRRGILTAGHVAEKYEKLPDVGLVRFISGTQQRRIVKFEGARHLILESSDDWTETGLDLAFTYLAPEVADSIGAQSVFLNMEKNRMKIEAGAPKGPSIDVMFGLVAEYSAKPVKEGGQFVSPMRAVIYRGNARSDTNGLLRFQTADESPEKLPKDFGGLSGSGLWRIHYRDHGDGKFEITEKVLWGITSWQMNKEKNTGAIAGQGWDRIDQGLIRVVREQL